MRYQHCLVFLTFSDLVGLHPPSLSAEVTPSPFALSLTVLLLRERVGRESDSVVVLRQVQNLNSSELEEAICGCLDSLTPLLQANRKVPTRLRVDVMQFIVNLLRVGKKVGLHSKE